MLVTSIYNFSGQIGYFSQIKSSEHKPAAAK